MTYRSLLVLLAQDPLCAKRVQVAIQLARGFDCHLDGVAPTGLIPLPTLTATPTSLVELGSIAQGTLREQAAQAAQYFSDECRTAGVKSFEAFVDDADLVASLLRRTRCNDLTVLTQADPSATDHRLAQGIVEQVVLYSARPTLVLPYAGRLDAIGQRIMVAWNGSREAVRALADALPLLRRAQHVQVFSWDEKRIDPGETPRSDLDALHAWLQRHGVAAEMHVEATDIDIADAMLSRAADLGTDLIVMGAYGHSRWAERVLGGATRGLLGSMTVPVLMSH